VIGESGFEFRTWWAFSFNSASRPRLNQITFTSQVVPSQWLRCNVSRSWFATDKMSFEFKVAGNGEEETKSDLYPPKNTRLFIVAFNMITSGFVHLYEK